MQIVQEGPSLAALSGSMLGQSLGRGLGNFTGDYFANKALQDLVNDPKLKDAPLSERWNALQGRLGKYGERGQKLLQGYLQKEQLAQQERSQQINSSLVNKMLKDEEITDEDIKGSDPALQIAAFKARQPKSPMGERAVPQTQIDAMKKAHEVPGYEDMTESQKYQTLIDSGVSAQNAIKEATLRSQQATREDQKIESAYNAQKNFIDDTTKSYRGFETEMKPRLLQMQHMNPEDLVSPTAAVFLEKLGIPLGALEDPSSELYQKLSQDLLKGLPETYGNRILKVEVDNFLKTIPTLLNSPDGRRMIASNMLKLGEMKEVYYNAMRNKQREYLDNGKPLPRDFQQVIFDQVKPQIDRINNEFIKMSDIKSVPPETIPFFGPDGEIKFVPKEHADWASNNGGRRIW
jgi:hypothetical protein